MTKEGWIKRKENGKGIPWNKGIKMPNFRHSKQFEKGGIPWNKGTSKYIFNCLKCSKEFQTDGIPAKYCSQICFHSLNKKDGHYKWIKDRSKVKKSERRQDANYKIWMLSVKKRDGWKCKIENKECKGRLEAHHILTWKDHPELRYEVNNGISLCSFHHPRRREDERKLAKDFQNLIEESMLNFI